MVRTNQPVVHQENASGGSSFIPPENSVEESVQEGTAYIPALSERYESLDYDFIENEIYKNEEMSAGHQLNIWRMTINRWVVCFFIGIFTALIACLIDVFVKAVSRLKFESVAKLFDQCIHQSNCLYFPILTWIAWNCALILVAASLVLYMSGPVAAGSGIPQVKCFLNGVQIPGVVRLKTLVAKVIGVACSVAGGLAVGKEGPMIHSGAVVAAGISQGRCITFPFDFRVFEYFRSDREKRDFVCAGAAAGVAAAFGAPIGGVLFSLEEGASFWNQSLTWRIFFSSMISFFTLSSVLSVVEGNAGRLSWAGLVNFGTFENPDYKVWEIFLFILMGIFGGLTGAIFNFVSMKLTLFRMKYIRRSWQKLLEALIVAFVSGVVAVLIIYYANDCKPYEYINPSHSVERPMQLWCPDGQYSASALLFFQTPEQCVKSLFHPPSPKHSFKPLVVAVFAICYYFLSVWTYGLSVPSGLFIPSLLIGAAWGHLVGLGIQELFPNISVDLGMYALAGATAQLGGVVRMTISLCAIIIEATHDISFGLPIMLILMTAKWVGDCFGEGIYDLHIHLAEVPILGWEPPHLASNIPAVQVMCPKVTVLRQKEKVDRIYEILRSDRHHAYPIVDDLDAQSIQDGYRGITFGRLRGLILRYQLITLLQHKVFSEDIEGMRMVSTTASLKLKDFRDAYPRYRVALEHINLTPIEKNCWIDFRPYMNPTPHRVSQDASLNTLFQLFRSIGLRHVIVVDNDNKVLGMVTRKDLARFKNTRYNNQYAVRELYFSVRD